MKAACSRKKQQRNVCVAPKAAAQVWLCGSDKQGLMSLPLCICCMYFSHYFFVFVFGVSLRPPVERLDKMEKSSAADWKQQHGCLCNQGGLFCSQIAYASATFTRKEWRHFVQQSKENAGRKSSLLWTQTQAENANVSPGGSHGRIKYIYCTDGVYFRNTCMHFLKVANVIKIDFLWYCHVLHVSLAYKICSRGVNICSISRCKSDPFRSKSMPQTIFRLTIGSEFISAE